MALQFNNRPVLTRGRPSYYYLRTGGFVPIHSVWVLLLAIERPHPQFCGNSRYYGIGRCYRGSRFGRSRAWPVRAKGHFAYGRLLLAVQRRSERSVWSCKRSRLRVNKSRLGFATAV